MKVLFITQKVDEGDWMVGFACDWIDSLSRKVDRLEVLCLEKGRHSLKIPLYSMGKEEGKGRAGRLLNFHRCLRITHMDVVFCHMNPIYAVLAAPYVRLFGKRLVFWYTHGHVSTLLKWAAYFSDLVLTATPEGYRLPDPEALVIGHGINRKIFHPGLKKKSGKSFRIISVGRMSPVKNLLHMIDAVGILVKEKSIGNLHLILAGGPGTKEHKDYVELLRYRIEQQDLGKYIEIHKPIPHPDIPSFYRRADLFCTMSGTDSLDKAIIEAMACGIPVVGSNSAFAAIARANGMEKLVVEKNNPGLLAETIDRFIKIPPSQRRIVIEKGKKIAAEHDLDRLTDRLVEAFQQVSGKNHHPPRLDFIINSRVPSERAHFLQAIKMCEAFAGKGCRVRFYHPKRLNTPGMEGIKNLWDFFGVQPDFTFRRLRALDLHLPRLRSDILRFWICEATFALSVFFHFLIFRRSTDIIYSRDPFALFLLLANRKAFSAKIYFEAHDFPRTLTRRQIQLFRKLDGLAVISKGVRNRFLQWGFPEEKILLAPLAFDPRPFANVENRLSARKRLGLPLKKKFVVYSGHLFEDKGVRVLARASRHMPQNIEIVVVGGMEKEIQRLKTYCRINNLSRVRVEGYRSPIYIPDYLSAADVLVIPYRGCGPTTREYNHPLKWPEYLAAGRPIVASDLPSLRSLVEADDPVIFVEPDNAQALAEGIIRALGENRSGIKGKPNIDENYCSSRGKRSLPTWRRRAEKLLCWMDLPGHC